jgi:hypothetical protein
MRFIFAITVLIAGISAADINPAALQDPKGEVALVEIVDWGVYTFKHGDTHHVGFLHAKTIEAKGESLPSQFRLSFTRAISEKSDPTPWNNLPARSDGRLELHEGEWIIGRFIQKGNTWEVIPGDELFALSRPEDMSPERLQRVQAYFSTPLIRIWIPGNDVLEDVLNRVRWRMSEAEFKQAFANASLVEDKWILQKAPSFRKTMVIKQPNTEILFEFSGVVDNKSPNVVPASSSLVSFQIKHPLKNHPGTPYLRPPESMHYKYVKKLHDACIERFKKEAIEYKHENSGSGGEYMIWEKIVSDTAGTITFVYWSDTSHEGVTAMAPHKLIAEDLQKEKSSAAQATKDWPFYIHGPISRPH